MASNKLLTDISFIEKVESLGEDKRVVVMCRHMLTQIGSQSGYDEEVLRIRTILTRTLPAGTEIECDLLEREYDYVFNKLLTKNERFKAAQLLREKAERLHGERFWRALVQLSDLFGKTEDYNIAHIVLSGYERMLEECPLDDPDYIIFFEKLIDLLGNSWFEKAKGVEWLDHIDEAITDTAKRRQFLSIVLKFYSSRRQDIGFDLNWIIARNYNLLGNHDEAIHYWLELLSCGEFKDDHHNLSYWIAESYFELGYFEHSLTFAKEALKLSDDDSDERQNAFDLLAVIERRVGTAEKTNCKTPTL